MVRIIDASVAMKWFLKEEGCEKALAILSDLLEHPRNYAVPELFYFELVHVLHRTIPDPAMLQIQLLNQVLVLGMHRFPMTPDLAKEVRHFQSLGLSGYDGAYVALAKLTRGRWLTFDRTAHRKIAHLKLSEML